MGRGKYLQSLRQFICSDASGPASPCLPQLAPLQKAGQFGQRSKGNSFLKEKQGLFPLPDPQGFV